MPYHASRALALLRVGTGDSAAEFRDDQEQAIRHVVEGRGRLLVVQKTGWGKSFVYFIAAKLLREQSAGPALADLAAAGLDAESDRRSGTHGRARADDQLGE